MSEIDPDLVACLKENGYIALRLMPDGTVAGINPFIYTYGLCTKLDFCGYYARWCYKHPIEAMLALAEWDGEGDPPGKWIKQKGPVERHNPALYDIIAINSDGREYAVEKS